MHFVFEIDLMSLFFENFVDANSYWIYNQYTTFYVFRCHISTLIFLSSFTLTIRAFSRSFPFSPSAKLFHYLNCEIRYSGIVCTYPYYMSCLYFILSTIVCLASIISVIRSFVILDLQAGFLQKSISVTSNIRLFVSFIAILHSYM